MNQLAWIGPSVLALVALGGNYVQQRRITTLEARITATNPASTGGSSAEDTAALTARIERLERLITWRATSAAGAAPAAAIPPVVGAPADVQQLREDVDALLTGEAVSTEQGKARLRALMAETQQAQWTERQERRDERIISRLAEAARLNTRQREDLTKAMADERAQRSTLLAKARGGVGSPEDIRPALQALRAQTDQKARAILDAEQYKQYEASRTSGRNPRGGNGGGANGGPTNE